jgi:hypothetical protein
LHWHPKQGVRVLSPELEKKPTGCDAGVFNGPRRINLAALFLSVLLAVLVLGCGGGSGGSTTTETVAPTGGSTTSESPTATSPSGLTYPIVDTGQISCYDATSKISAPDPGFPFFGQDAQYQGNQPTYTRSSDGLTVFDNVTGLIWQRSPDTSEDGSITAADQMTFAQAQAYADKLNAARFGGYADWRLPSIKELYSLIDFTGAEPMPTATDATGAAPYIDTSAFAFAHGDTSAGERVIDAQYVSATRYVSTTMNGNQTVFGVNFADGRIKGYPSETGPGGAPKTFYVICVRGNPAYGTNDFEDNGDGTITDGATGLMWAKSDSGNGLDWQEALAWAESKNSENYLGYNDWRLPNAKELESLIDYTRSPGTTHSAAIDPLFSCTQITNEAGQPDYPCYWTSTTHAAVGGRVDEAVYVAFGRAMGYMDGAWEDVHGAGAQRSDPKVGDPANYPNGRGPQGDAIRIYNYVRLVRDGT